MAAGKRHSVILTEGGEVRNSTSHRICENMFTLLWRHNGCDGVSNHQPHDCLLTRLFRRGSKKTSKLHVTGLCEGNSPVTGEFPAQRASNAENVFIWWRHYEYVQTFWRGDRRQAITQTDVDWYHLFHRRHYDSMIFEPNENKYTSIKCILKWCVQMATVSFSPQCIKEYSLWLHMGLLLLTWINFNPNMGK